ncbi:VOC family protein [Mucilaginibacter jinjuensis]|uniref:VOC family protein n=1 Tax=Mucilaginibacter jinjuensis TaxID=1176721 RepID=A0ABY7T5I1_9SPHI|nr:VOC family protein [Mucilaginibacter jinjuensis]WCT10962.1 VOC family protein [Mucilaginibacter jinjuensis]
MKISIISIPVTDQSRAKEFYIKLGFQVLVDAPMGGDQRWVQLALPGTEGSIALVTWFESMIPGSIRGLVITVDDIEQKIKELNVGGIEVEPIEKLPWGRFAAVEDPDGNRLSLHQE